MYDVFPLKSFYCYSCKAVALYRFFFTTRTIWNTAIDPDYKTDVNCDVTNNLSWPDNPDLVREILNTWMSDLNKAIFNQ